MRAGTLYDPALLARAKAPIGSGTLAGPCRRTRVENRVCGDEVELDVLVSAGSVEALAHRVRGCAVVKASASLLAETVTGRDEADAHARIDALRVWLAGSGSLPPDLAPLVPMRAFPARNRCTLLPWEALARALATA